MEIIMTIHWDKKKKKKKNDFKEGSVLEDKNKVNQR
jgi:hypothetical protein